MSIYQQNPDGSWTPAQPVQGTRLYRVEQWLRDRGFIRLANVLTRYDEMWLGR